MQVGWRRHRVDEHRGAFLVEAIDDGDIADDTEGVVAQVVRFLEILSLDKPWETPDAIGAKEGNRVSRP